MFEKLRRWLRFNAIYISRPPWDTGVSPPELLSFLAETQPGSALDLGSGPGTNLVTMADRGWQVTGVDFALLSVCQARRKLRRAGLRGRVIWGDVTRPHFLDQRFDFVLDMGCFHGLKEDARRTYRQNLARWLRPGGVYLLYAHFHQSGSSHGVRDADLLAFTSFLSLTWRKDSGESRPDGGGGRPAVWARFDCIEQY